LLADVDGASAHIDVRVGDGAGDLGQGDVVSVELVQVDLDLVFLGGAAPGVDLNHAGHRKKAALQDPVLDGAQIGQSEMRRPDHLVAIDLADQARSENLRRDVVGKRDVLLQVDRRLGEGEVIVDTVIEGDADEGEAVERGRADVFDPELSQADLPGSSVTLHLLRRDRPAVAR
jgi:hypothetical protein